VGLLGPERGDCPDDDGVVGESELTAGRRRREWSVEPNAVADDLDPAGVDPLRPEGRCDRLGNTEDAVRGAPDEAAIQEGLEPRMPPRAVVLVCEQGNPGRLRQERSPDVVSEEVRVDQIALLREPQRAQRRTRRRATLAPEHRAGDARGDQLLFERAAPFCGDDMGAVRRPIDAAGKIDGHPLRAACRERVQEHHHAYGR
jgi:hypothetical protein